MVKKSTVLFEKEYDSSSIADMPEEVDEAVMAVGEYGFWSGRIIVRIEHQED